ncbi:DUF6498-containing protein [Gelidibacter sp. F63206]|uniref:DUF6498-containing protein n=1 Tax=Gelidibacter sp. F63206 TaxID=2926425 RepID=UPI001FF48CB8|nr:DUF6498-containing protein [Gelidibacter sp. F63206]MCK0114503.1 DUF6498-containing protein [Gelidibacter sp. F63206]
MMFSVFMPNRNNSYVWMNVVFLVGFLLMGKISPYAIIFGYFLETLIIGVFNVFKMVAASRNDGSGKTIIFLVLFFMFHYGMFVAIQSLFVFVIVGIDGQTFIKEPFYIIENYRGILALEGMTYVLTILIGTQLVKFIFDFMLSQKHLEFTAYEIMYKPYVRIVIQQFAVIIAFFFFILFVDATLMAALLLILFKSLIDFGLSVIREDTKALDYMVEKLYDGKTPKDELRKQLLLFSE